MTKHDFPTLRQMAVKEECIALQCDDLEKRKLHIAQSIVYEAMADVLADPANSWILEGRLPPLRLVKND